MSGDRSSISRRLLLAGLLSGAAGVALGEPLAASLRPPPRPGAPRLPHYASAQSLVERAKLGEGTRVGFAVADAATGEVLEVLNPLLPQPPASTCKALTALYALDALGPDFRFRTTLTGTGPVVEGVLKGDLVLSGSGDPTLDTDRLATLAANLRDAGVRQVEGRFLTWDGALPRIDRIDSEQPDQVGYNPGVSGLNLNFNRVHFEWRRAGKGWSTAMDARSAAYRPDVTVARMAVVTRRYPIYTYEDSGEADLWTVASGALGDDGSRWLPVRKPAAYTAEVFQILARAEGIPLAGAQPAEAAPAGEELAAVESGDLRTILRGMLKHSTNITAEAVGLAATARRAGQVDSLPSSAGSMSQWLAGRIGSPKPALVDHSGLGGASRICARDMVEALVRIGPGLDLEPLLKPVTMKDDKGRPIENHPVTILAKTGTLNFVSALAGYITLPGGRRLAFATFVADTARRDAIPLEQRERPDGLSGWLGRARMLQIRLIDRWSTTLAA
ncbi:D-alanyl-D-alanine carboxypeptidase/D-alanyl-D-alanine-endopeptidase [Tropicimonas sp.]|uniref:D-alanyl-D-alanine carboxypeptidase/D-alanyl-D-alanine endopeptidase n=1 Tax=Tropicimonas sp. TaxID=2067044 RepID=UPI003A8ADF27